MDLTEAKASASAVLAGAVDEGVDWRGIAQEQAQYVLNIADYVQKADEEVAATKSEAEALNATLQAQVGDLAGKGAAGVEATKENKKLKAQLADAQKKHVAVCTAAAAVLARIVDTESGTHVLADSSGYLQSLRSLL